MNLVHHERVFILFSYIQCLENLRQMKIRNPFSVVPCWGILKSVNIYYRHTMGNLAFFRKKMVCHFLAKKSVTVLSDILALEMI